jgi:hypothetical protein
LWGIPVSFPILLRAKPLESNMALGSFYLKRQAADVGTRGSLQGSLQISPERTTPPRASYLRRRDERPPLMPPPFILCMHLVGRQLLAMRECSTVGFQGTMFRRSSGRI